VKVDGVDPRLNVVYIGVARKVTENVFTQLEKNGRVVKIDDDEWQGGNLSDECVSNLMEASIVATRAAFKRVQIGGDKTGIITEPDQLTRNIIAAHGKMRIRVTPDNITINVSGEKPLFKKIRVPTNPTGETVNIISGTPDRITITNNSSTYRPVGRK